MAAALNRAANPDPLVRRLEADELALEQLARDHYSDGRISRREYFSAKEAIDRRISETVAALADNTPPTHRDLRELWDRAEIDARRRILAELIDKVEVLPGTPGRKAFDSKRLKVSWRNI
jgi:hypothetical protein